MIQGMHTYPSPNTSTQTTEMDLHSGSRDLTVPSLMFMRMLQGTLLSNGKPPEMPLDLDRVGKAPPNAAPNPYQGRVGAIRDQVTTLEGLKQLKNEGDLPLTSLSPSLFSESALWEEKNGRISLPSQTFGMGDAKKKEKKISNIIDDFMDISPMLLLMESVDLYWKPQLFV